MATWFIVTLVTLPLATTLAIGADWNDFSGTCLHPASVPTNSVLVFTSPAKVLKAIERYERDQLGGTCGQEFAEAFAKLKWLLEEVVLSDICGQEAYERIRAFHSEFIHFYVPELTREQLFRLGSNQVGGDNEQIDNLIEIGNAKSNLRSQQTVEQSKLKPIPKALRYFFINFAKQANAHCKQKLIERLESIQSDVRLINPDDFKVMDKYRQDSMRLSFLYELTQADKSSYTHERISDFNRLEIVDFERQVSGSSRFGSLKPMAQSDAGGQENELPQANNGDDDDDDDDDGSKLYLQVPFGDNLKRIKEACRKRFMPIYMELFAPVIKLNNLGYIDRIDSKREDRELDEQEQISRWIVIIQTCEILKDIEILHDASAENAIFDLVRARSHLVAFNKQRQKKRTGAATILSDDIKLLSRKEAEQLMKSSSNNQILDQYHPRLTRVEHNLCKYTDIMWRRKPEEVHSQVKEFERDVSRIVSRKTSLLRSLKRDLTFKLKLAFNVGKTQVLQRDETSKLGRLVLFVERHQNLIRGFGLIMSIIMMSLALSG